MRYLAALTVVVGLASYFGWGPFKGLRPRRAPRMQLTALTEEAAAGDPCAGTQRCVVVYMAPWCPACKQAKPLVRAMRAKLLPPDVAVKVVIGMGDRERAREMASEVGGAVFFDPDGDYHRALGGNGVPYWVVLDRDQKIHGHMAGFRLPLEAHLSALGL